MRIILKNSRAFFDEILLNKKLTLRKLSKIMGWNYSNLKDYRRGELTIPEEVFISMLKLSPKKDFWVNNKKELADNWGAIKGGSIAGIMPDKNRRAAHARKFRKLLIVNIKLNKFFCEFYGALLGDGCISRYKDSSGDERIVIQFSGNKMLDSYYFKYLKDRLNLEYGLYVYYYEHKNKNVCILSIKNKGLCLELNKNFDVPIGLKYAKLKLSSKILKLPWNIKKYVLRGLFDTDGCIFARKDEDYKYPHISISSKSKSFREQICSILREQGYPAYVNNSNVRIKGIENVRRWFLDIGSSNSRNLKKYEYFLKQGCLPARLLM